MKLPTRLAVDSAGSHSMYSIPKIKTGMTAAQPVAAYGSPRDLPLNHENAGAPPPSPLGMAH